ncbi:MULTISPECIES: hypothetical protein [unclassified Streptomyces]|uniref:hypothetical protein n=1 Tax=unclassified Streptomyces TaxID=2593676 RepID=UPI001F04D5D9|nr:MULTISPECIES: hypothetical protein [unclassified Streptomyces]MCH0564284.1 hypothetical protein [Streptomyces sp. MUM 2J]MCH0569455.1 hypothetical protein [Streptomyces sp. MUM 136J]
MSESAGQTGLRAGATAVVHESYSFACMRCGHGWEQSYAIEHHTDAEGHQYVIYVADDRIVPSPLRRPLCQNCDNHVVRIMRAGRVASVRGAQGHLRRPAPQAGPVEAPVAASELPVAESQSAEGHHWHLSDLLHVFQRKAG